MLMPLSEAMRWPCSEGWVKHLSLGQFVCMLGTACGGCATMRAHHGGCRPALQKAGTSENMLDISGHSLFRLLDNLRQMDLEDLDRS